MSILPSAEWTTFFLHKMGIQLEHPVVSPFLVKLSNVKDIWNNLGLLLQDNSYFHLRAPSKVPKVIHKYS